jgi:LysR family transcriptional regulator, mexEF-oprN operon transcriptional activator
VFTGRKFDPSVVDGEFKLALNDPLETLLLPSLVAQLRTQAPLLMLSVQPIPAWQQLECLDKGDIQLAVGYFPKVRSVHEKKELYTAPFSCVFNPAMVHLDSPLDLNDLAEMSHIHTIAPAR